MGSCEIGLYGLGVMGKSLALNLIDHGFRTAVTSKAESERTGFAYPQRDNWELCADEASFVSTLARPRVIFLMITAGRPVDLVLDALLPLLDAGDVVIDGGNSYYEDTCRRCARTQESGVHFLGVGVSGGQEGARNGPCMMVGGSAAGWETARQYLQPIAAKAPDGTPCCAYVGADGAGHYVKMVHNGIEYALMQQIADVYGLLRDAMGKEAPAIGRLFGSWRNGILSSYLVEITARVLQTADVDGAPLVDHILDVARQKGTGSWTVLEAVRRGVYVPCIDEALFTRFQSEMDRGEAAALLPVTVSDAIPVPTDSQLERALYLAMICSYAQGLTLIEKAGMGDLSLAVSLWRSGCIIRSALLEEILAANGVSQLLSAPVFANARAMEADLRAVVLYAAAQGVAVPSLTAALTYYDQARTSRMNVNLVQALRDCFGAHTYERTDQPGSFHTEWESK